MHLKTFCVLCTVKANEQRKQRTKTYNKETGRVSQPVRSINYGQDKQNGHFVCFRQLVQKLKPFKTFCFRLVTDSKVSSNQSYLPISSFRQISPVHTRLCANQRTKLMIVDSPLKSKEWSKSSWKDSVDKSSSKNRGCKCCS